MNADPKRLGRLVWETHTGIKVQGMSDGEEITCDMAELETDSVIEFLRSRGGHNPWAENIVLTWLGREQIAHEYPVMVDGAAETITDADFNSVTVKPIDKGIEFRLDCEWFGISIEDPRLYNAALLFLQAIKVHNAEEAG